MVTSKYQIERKIKPQELIDVIRGYTKVKGVWRHQGRYKSADGKVIYTDCVGLLILALAELEIEIPDITGYTNYGRLPFNRQLERMIETVCEPTEKAVNGCLLALKIRAAVQHIALFVNDGKYDYPTMIHASSESGICEINYDERWQSRTDSYWLLPGLIY